MAKSKPKTKEKVKAKAAKAVAKSNQSKSASAGKSSARAKVAAKARPAAARSKPAKAKPAAKGKPAAKAATSKSVRSAKAAAKPAKAAKGGKATSPARAAKPAPAARAKAAAKSAAKAAAKAAPKAPARSGAAAPKRPAARAGVGSNGGRAVAAPHLPHIEDRTLRQIIDKLDEMRGESQNIVNQHMQTDMKPREESSDVGDDLDQASSERDREFNLIMHQRHLRRLQQIEDAFERIQDGSYGLCEGTDEPINPRRLLIMPLARYSLEYQEQQEKTLGRSLEPEGYAEGEDSFSAEE